MKYDAKLHALVIKQLGFSQETRIFHNAGSTQINTDLNANEDKNEDIGTVLLKDFIILIGINYGLFSANEE